MIDYIELIKQFTKADYIDKVNLHIHTNFSDGEGDVNEIVASAKSKGYKYIAISDHNTVAAYLNSNILQDDMVIPAVEFDCWCGTVFLHLLAYGVDIHHSALQPFYAQSDAETRLDIVRIFAKRDIKKLIEAIHQAGGIAVLAHPACCWAVNFDGFVKKLMRYGLDGMEVYYPYERHRGIIKFHFAKNVEKVADKYGLIKTGGTDCHAKSL